jgi:putative transcriptional regulator
MSRAKEEMRRYSESMDKEKEARWARKTQFIPQKNGSLRRLVTRRDGTVEKDEVMVADRLLVAEARAKTGLSQEKILNLSRLFAGES